LLQVTLPHPPGESCRYIYIIHIYICRCIYWVYNLYIYVLYIYLLFIYIYISITIVEYCRYI
jgi:hypothetical protein